MTRLTLIVLVDALRADYPRRMPYLSALAAGGLTGRLREDFGFVPRAAYFGGLSPSAFGFTNMYCYDPARSPFAVARGVQAGELTAADAERLGARAWIDEQARRRVTPFTASYLSSAAIPLDLVAQFDLVETRAPWDPRVGYRTVFDRLRERGETWFTCAWPETNRLDDHSDRGIVAATLAALQPPARLAFVHLQELDAIGHAYGPESAEVDETIRATDDLLRKLVSSLEDRFDAVDLVVFGDHGMVSVTGTLDVWSALARLGRAAGRDFIFFLDSTMARFWFQTAAARRQVAAALEALPGRVLGDHDLAAFDLAGCDRRNGELIFLAHPGTLIFPNFFQRTGQLVKGMHGYDPGCPDNQGYFLVRDAGQTAAGELGIVGPTAVYAHAMRQLGAAECRIVAAPAPAPRAAAFTQHPDPAAERLVAAQLAELVTETRRAVPEATAIVLTGSFGRGEGGVETDEHGRLRPVNDYDVLLIAPQAPKADLDALGRGLAARFGLDFVHFSRWAAVDSSLPLTLANYDVYAGHRVLWGDPNVLAGLPRYAAADFPAFEAVQLLLNRMAGLLTGVRGPFTAPSSLTRGERRYLRTQTMKALMALGDVHLMRWGAYACSYRTRLERLTWLAPGAGLDGDRLTAITRAYRFKLHPAIEIDEDLGTLAARTSRWLIEAFVDAAGRLARRRLADAVEAAGSYYDLTTTDRHVVAMDNEYCADRLSGRPDGAARPAPEGSIRQSIYTALPLLLAASHGDAGAFAAAVDRLNRCLAPDRSADLTAANWDLARAQTAGSWLTLVH